MSIFSSIAQNDILGLEALLQNKAMVDSKDEDGRTGLMHAVIQGKGEIVDLLLRHKADLKARDKNGYTALHFAAQNYQLIITKKLLEAGAEIDAVDVFGNTPLSKAVFNSKGKGEVIELLLNSGANRLQKNLSGVSPEDLVKTIGNYNIKQFFKKNID